MDKILLSDIVNTFPELAREKIAARIAKPRIVTLPDGELKEFHETSAHFSNKVWTITATRREDVPHELMHLVLLNRGYPMYTPMELNKMSEMRMANDIYKQAISLFTHFLQDNISHPKLWSLLSKVKNGNRLLQYDLSSMFEEDAAQLAMMDYLIRTNSKNPNLFGRDWAIYKALAMKQASTYMCAKIYHPKLCKAIDLIFGSLCSELKNSFDAAQKIISPAIDESFDASQHERLFCAQVKYLGIDMQIVGRKKYGKCHKIYFTIDTPAENMSELRKYIANASEL